MRAWQQFCTLSRARQIALVVFCLHLVLVFALSTHHLIHRKKPVKTKIAVHTVRPRAPQPVNSTRTVASPPSAKPAQTAQQKKTEGKTVSKKTMKKDPEVRRESPTLSSAKETLLREIAEDLEILNAGTNRVTRPSLSVPMSLPQSVQVEETDFPDPSYGDILTAFLQSALDLPEYGEVRARLAIDSNGQLTHLDILETQSRKNGEFLKKRLPELLFPPSNTPLSFTITFKNRA